MHFPPKQDQLMAKQNQRTHVQIKATRGKTNQFTAKQIQLTSKPNWFTANRNQLKFVLAKNKINSQKISRVIVYF